MPTLAEVAKFCTSTFVPSRRKDIWTAIRYVAAAYESTPEQLPWSLDLEVDYRQALDRYFEAHPKSAATRRNVAHNLATLWKAWHAHADTLPKTPPPPRRSTTLPKQWEAERQVNATSPYKHYTWRTQHPYTQPASAWPGDIAQRWDTYRHARRYQDTLRTTTLEKYRKEFTCYVSYLMLRPEERLAHLHEDAQPRLRLPRQRDDLRALIAPSPLTSWDELFDIARLHSYVVWQSWRVHPWHTPLPADRQPSYPSWQGFHTAILIEQLAKRTGRPEHPQIHAFARRLPMPKRVHDKQAPYHRFDLDELEAVAQAMMAEARRMTPHPTPRHGERYPGNKQAIMFQTGLILALAWRCPLRARNWCEAILGVNLKPGEDGWHWHFEGEELKIGRRQQGTRVNVFDLLVDPDIVPALEEYVERYRPHLPNAAEDPHVLLTYRGYPMIENTLVTRLRIQVYRYTGKRLYVHLFRSLFMTHHLSAGLDINSVAYGTNDQPATIFSYYNELMADRHQVRIHEANRQALLGRPVPALTPPVIQVTPAVRPRPVDPAQLGLEL